MRVFALAVLTLLGGCDALFGKDDANVAAVAPAPTAVVAPEPPKQASPALFHNFQGDKTYNWSATMAELEATSEGLSFATNGADARINRLALNFNGADARYVVVDVTRTAPSADGKWDGTAYYATDNHKFENQYFAQMLPTSTVPNVGERRKLVWDMSKLVRGGTDWLDSKITGLRFDLDAGAGGAFIIHSIAATPIEPDLTAPN